MNTKSVVCSYTFTLDQYKVAMKGRWKKNAQLWTGLVFVVVFIGIIVYSHVWKPNPDWGWSNDFPLLIFVVLMIYLAFFNRTRAFARSSAYNEKRRYELSSQSYRLTTDTTSEEVSWSVIPRWRENPDGFQIYMEGLGSFHWLPKSGFETPEVVAQARDILRDNISEKKDKRSFLARYRFQFFLAFIVVVVAAYVYSTAGANQKMGKLNDEAAGLEKQGLYAKALEVRKKAWELCRVDLARKDPDYAWIETRMAYDYTLVKDYDNAAPLFADAIKLEEGLPTELSNYIDTLNRYGLYYRDRGQFNKARELHQQAFDLQEKHVGDNPSTAIDEYNLALDLIDLGKTEEARAHLEDCLRIQQKFLGDDHADTIDTREKLESLGGKLKEKSN